MDHGKYFGNEELSDGEVWSLIAYSILFIIGLIIIFRKSPTKYKLADILVFLGLFLILAQNTYHLEHGEQLEQYQLMGYALIFGLINYIVGWVMANNGFPVSFIDHSKDAFYWFGLFLVLATIIFVMFGTFDSGYPGNLTNTEKYIAYTGIVGGILLLTSYLAVRSKK
ncbi:hypothetical protein LCGC14_0174940 [marine sediment metagenome]|uniref:Uncharacterized protein n=1 Tax=marine sediment metagenome TaxID=412755 RepID=A0A0F9UR54_9ZZZZ